MLVHLTKLILNQFGKWIKVLYYFSYSTLPILSIIFFKYMLLLLFCTTCALGIWKWIVNFVITEALNKHNILFWNKCRIQINFHLSHYSMTAFYTESLNDVLIPKSGFRLKCATSASALSEFPFRIYWEGDIQSVVKK